MLPVVGPDRKLIGVVTDRDICVAMATRNRLPGELNVSEIATRKVFTCKPNDEMLEALHTMADNHVRRLPVVDDDGRPQGIRSMDDVIVHGDLNKRKGSSDLPSDEIIRSLKTLFGQKLPRLRKEQHVMDVVVLLRLHPMKCEAFLRVSTFNDSWVHALSVRGSTRWR